MGKRNFKHLSVDTGHDHAALEYGYAPSTAFAHSMSALLSGDPHISSSESVVSWASSVYSDPSTGVMSAIASETVSIVGGTAASVVFGPEAYEVGAYGAGLVYGVVGGLIGPAMGKNSKASYLGDSRSRNKRFSFFHLK